MAKTSASKKDEEQKEIAEVVKAFDPIAGEDYALIPGKSKLSQWVFRQIWIIPLLILILFSVTSLGVYTRIENPENFKTFFRWDWIYPRAGYTWCYIDLGDGVHRDKIYAGGDLECGAISQDPIETIDVTALERYAGINFRPLMVCLVFFTSLLLVSILYSRFIYNFPKSLIALASAGRLRKADKFLRPKKTHWWDIRPHNWETYPQDLQNALNSPWRSILFVLVLATAYTIMLYAGRDWLYKLSGFWPYAWDTVLYLIMPFLTAYVANGMWTIIIAGLYVRWLTPIYKLDVQPEHGDGCGGLKRLGDLCFSMAIMITVPTAVFGVGWMIGAIGGSVGLIIVILAMSTAICLAVVTFFVPLLDIHSDMASSAALFEDEANGRITLVKEDLRELIGKGSESKEIGKLEKRLEKLEKLYPADLKFPTWPFTTTVLLTFYSAQIVPIVTVVTGMVEFIRLLAPAE
jgi:hypothetical protein